MCIFYMVQLDAHIYSLLLLLQGEKAALIAAQKDPLNLSGAPNRWFQ